MSGQQVAEGESGRRRADRDERIKEAIALGLTYAEVAQEVTGVSVRTIARLMSDQGFASDVWQRRAERMSALSGQLIGAAMGATDVIRREMALGERSADRVRAAGLALTLAARFRREHELELRLRAVEERLGLTASGVVDVQADN